MPRTSSSKSRGWCITVNSISDVEWDECKERVRAKKNIRYFCGQLEVGELGRRHLQAYAEFSGPSSLAAVRKLFPRCHAEKRRGKPSEAAAYCRKEESAVAGTFFEVGELPQETASRQGARADLDAVRDAVRGGASVGDILEQFPVVYARYPRFVDKCLLLYSGRRSWKTEVRVYVGPTGCGKTQSAFEEFPDIWSKPPGAWFDGYNGEPHVLFDDFDGGRDCGITFRHLLQLLDRYRMVVPFKGGFTQWSPRVIIITTNVQPGQWYPWEDSAPLLRRIDVIKTWNK